MTKKEIKELALNKLNYYLSLPYKERHTVYLPNDIIYKIMGFLNHCPLCEHFFIENPKDNKSCGECPLIYPSCGYHNKKQLKRNIKLIKEWKI